jgi:hypothetical protein
LRFAPTCGAIIFLTEKKGIAYIWRWFGKMESFKTLLYYDGALRLECDCGKAFYLAYCNHDGSYVKGDAESGFYAKSGGLSDTDLASLFDKKDVYAYLLENVRPIDPMPIGSLYEDEACERPLAEAPRNHRVAYRKAIGNIDCSEKVLILRVSADRAKKYANGDAVFDVRTQRVFDFGIDYE